MQSRKFWHGPHVLHHGDRMRICIRLKSVYIKCDFLPISCVRTFMRFLTEAVDDNIFHRVRTHTILLFMGCSTKHLAFENAVHGNTSSRYSLELFRSLHHFLNEKSHRILCKHTLKCFVCHFEMFLLDLRR